MKKNILIIIVLLLATRMWAQTIPERAIDSLRNLLHQPKADTTTVARLNALGNGILFRPNATIADKDSAYALARTALSLAIKLKDAKGAGNSHMIISRYWRNKEDMVKGKDHIYTAFAIFNNAQLYTDLGYAQYELTGYYSLSGDGLNERICLIAMAAASFHKAGNRLKESDALKELADVRQVQGNYQQAYKDLKNALQIRQGLGRDGMEGLYDLIGDVCTSIGNLDEAVKYCLLAVEEAAFRKDSSMQLCTVYNHLGIAYYYQSDYTAATAALHKAVAIAEKNNALDEVDMISVTLSNMLIKQYRFAESNAFLLALVKKHPALSISMRATITGSLIISYLQLGELEKATPYYEELLVLKENKTLTYESRRGIFNALVDYNIASKDFKKARQYAAEQEAYAKVNGLLIVLAKNQYNWFRVDSAEKNYASALAHYKLYKQLNDSAYTITKSKQIAQLTIQYETEQKDKDILLKEKNIQLLTQQSALQNASLKQANMLRNIALVSGILLFIFFALFYNNYRSKIRINRQLEAQQVIISEKNASLQKLVTEKEWLVKEIHHRVKNNFHIVMGLLGTQSGYLKNEEAIAAITESRQRVHAMSLIHQKLYQSENLSAIGMPAYIHELVDYLKYSFDTRQKIIFTIHAAPIELDITHSVPIGLILNEAITNAIKYAFPGGREGTIVISLQPAGEDRLLLTVSDNGIGFPADIDYRNSFSMGMNLMRGLTKEISGEFTITNNQGTTISIVFPCDADLKQLT
ncbi:MAG: histidine kinase dimerization/phosphoacceptor domain -containing protein [Chitinophagaceae bacterium]